MKQQKIFKKKLLRIERDKLEELKKIRRLKEKTYELEEKKNEIVGR